MGLGVIGQPRSALLQQRCRLFRLAGAVQSETEIDLRFRVIGSQGQRPAQVRLGVPAGALQDAHIAETVVIIGLAAVDRDGADHQIGGVIEGALLTRQNAPQVKGVGMIGQGGQHRIIELLRLVQAAGGVMPHRGFEGGGDFQGGHGVCQGVRRIPPAGIAGRESYRASG